MDFLDVGCSFILLKEYRYYIYILFSIEEKILLFVKYIYPLSQK